MRKCTTRAVLWNVLSGTLLWTLVLMLAAPMTQSLYAQDRPAVTTVQYNNARTGWNRNERVLNIENVNPDTFGKLWATDPLDGQIYSAPLYVSGVNIGGETYNVVYVATENNVIYALNAETSRELWSYVLGPPGQRSLLRCGNIRPNVGITSTPVIDVEAKTLYAVGLTRQGVTQIFKMAAVDIETGRSIDGWPVTIDLPADEFDTRATSERGALLLMNGVVYVPFGGYFGDCRFYHGWVVAVDPNNPHAQIYYRTPGNKSNFEFGSGIWSTGGIAADDRGNIYAATGNSFPARETTLNYSNAVLRLAPPNLFFSERETDFFVPSNWVDLNITDDDLGSSTPMLLPQQEGSNTPNMIFITGKRGVGHLLNRDDLGGVANGDGVRGEGIYSTRVFSTGAFGVAAYYEDADAGPVMFLAGRGTQRDCTPSSTNGVVALGLVLDDDGNSSYRILWCTPSMGTAISPVVTSAPGQPGILWVVDAAGGVLYAYAFNATTRIELYNSNMVPGDALGITEKRLHFTAIDGKVFVANSANRIVAYGLRPK